MRTLSILVIVCGAVACLSLVSCDNKFDPASAAPSHAQVINVRNANVVTVARPENYPLVVAGEVRAPHRLNVTGSVFPDINREIPVITLASGRVVDVDVTLDQDVKKGQMMMKVQSPDISNAFDTYLKAVNDEQFANKEYLRSKDLFAHGAISQEMLDQA